MDNYVKIGLEDYAELQRELGELQNEIKELKEALKLAKKNGLKLKGGQIKAHVFSKNVLDIPGFLGDSLKAETIEKIDIIAIEESEAVSLVTKGLGKELENCGVALRASENKVYKYRAEFEKIGNMNFIQFIIWKVRRGLNEAIDEAEKVS